MLQPTRSQAYKNIQLEAALSLPSTQIIRFSLTFLFKYLHVPSPSHFSQHIACHFFTFLLHGFPQTPSHHFPSLSHFLLFIHSGQLPTPILPKAQALSKAHTTHHKAHTLSKAHPTHPKAQPKG